MKKIVLTTVLLLTIAVTAFAQNTFKEGHINFTISVTGNDQMAQMMNGSTMSISIKDSLSRTDVDMSIMQTKTIMNISLKKGTMLMDMMGNKYAIALSADDIKDQETKANSDYDVKYVDSTKVIAGHVCSKAIVTLKKDKKELTVWYAPDIPALVCNKDMYSKIKGMSLEYEFEQGPVELKFTCTLLDTKSVDPSIFTIPDGYTSMSMADFKAAMGGMQH